MILSGAGLVEASTSESEDEKPIYVHTTSQVEVKEDNYVIIPNVACWDLSAGTFKDLYHSGAGIYLMVLNNGEVNTEPAIPSAGGVTYGTLEADGTFTPATTSFNTTGNYYEFASNAKVTHTRIECTGWDSKGIAKGSIVLVDYYVKRTSGVKQIEITPDKFGGYFYLEGSTLFRRESDGKDLPAEIVIPKVKIQSNFTFTMASTGDPSTFDFVMDAFPDREQCGLAA